MKPYSGKAREGLVLARNHGALPKGKLLAAHELEGQDVHAIELEPGDLHEDPAAQRLARAVSGENVEVQPPHGGTLPIASRLRGVLRVNAARLAELNAIDDLAVMTLPDGQIVTEGETVARAKVVPFVTTEARVAQAEQIARGGLISVRRFVPLNVAAVVEDRLDAETLAGFRRDFSEKVNFFGGTLLAPVLARGDEDSIAAALRECIDRGAQLVLVAAGRAMDPLDPALLGLARASGTLVRFGIPAHPGALLWLGAIGTVPIVGVPSCGVASKPTALDMLLPLLFTGAPPSRELLVSLGAGGLVTRDNSFRLPPYRRPAQRGELG
jgi:hypothetical protein